MGLRMGMVAGVLGCAVAGVTGMVVLYVRKPHWPCVPIGQVVAEYW